MIELILNRAKLSFCGGPNTGPAFWLVSLQAVVLLSWRTILFRDESCGVTKRSGFSAEQAGGMCITALLPTLLE